jgi:hypothetical protein
MKLGNWGLKLPMLQASSATMVAIAHSADLREQLCHSRFSNQFVGGNLDRIGFHGLSVYPRKRGKNPGSARRKRATGGAALWQQTQMTRFSSGTFLMLQPRARGFAPLTYPPSAASAIPDSRRRHACEFPILLRIA